MSCKSAVPLGPMQKSYELKTHGASAFGDPPGGTLNSYKTLKIYCERKTQTKPKKAATEAAARSGGHRPHTKKVLAQPGSNLPGKERGEPQPPPTMGGREAKLLEIRKT